MKITKSRLQQIIQEELKRVLTESSDWHSDEHETLADRKFADRDWAPPEADLPEDIKDAIRNSAANLIHDPIHSRSTPADIAVQALLHVRIPPDMGEEALAFANDFIQDSFEDEPEEEMHPDEIAAQEFDRKAFGKNSGSDKKIRFTAKDVFLDK